MWEWHWAWQGQGEREGQGYGRDFAPEAVNGKAVGSLAASLLELIWRGNYGMLKWILTGQIHTETHADTHTY